MVESSEGPSERKELQGCESARMRVLDSRLASRSRAPAASPLKPIAAKTRVFQVPSQAEEFQRLDGVPSHILGARSSHMLLESNLWPISMTTTDRKCVDPLQ